MLYDTTLFDIFSKKMLFGAALMAGLVGVVSCSSCSKHDSVDPVKPVPTVTNTLPSVVPPLPDTQKVEVGAATIFLPLSFEERVGDSVGEHTNYKLFINRLDTQLIAFEAQDYSGTYEEYVLEGIRFLKDNNVTMQSATKLEAKGSNFVVVESSKDGIMAWLFLTTKDGKGYSLSCGGIETSKTLHDDCFKIFNSLEIK